jgi:hypothetical protein
VADVSDAHFRHDLAPFLTSPDPIKGDIGIGNITLVPEPGTLTLLACIGLVAARRSIREDPKYRCRSGSFE